MIPTSRLSAEQRTRIAALLADQPWFDFYWQCSLDDLASGLDNRSYRLGERGLGLVMGVQFDGVSVYSTVGQLDPDDTRCVTDGPARAEVHAQSEHAPWIRAQAGARIEREDRIAYYQLDARGRADRRADAPVGVEARRVTPADHAEVLSFYASQYRETVLSAWMLELPFVGVWVSGRLAAGAGTIVMSRRLSACHVGHFLTDPAQRGQGLAGIAAQALFDQLDAEGISSWSLGVSEDNVPAQRAYERLGFTRVDARPMFYLVARS
jgi:ribosomal protein S18 acetylase RimI-like enzyme